MDFFPGRKFPTQITRQHQLSPCGLVFAFIPVPAMCQPGGSQRQVSNPQTPVTVVGVKITSPLRENPNQSIRNSPLGRRKTKFKTRCRCPSWSFAIAEQMFLCPRDKKGEVLVLLVSFYDGARERRVSFHRESRLCAIREILNNSSPPSYVLLRASLLLPSLSRAPRDVSGLENALLRARGMSERRQRGCFILAT